MKKISRMEIRKLIYEINRPIRDRRNARKELKKQLASLPAETLAKLINMSSLGLMNFEVKDVDELEDEEVEILFNELENHTQSGVLIQPTSTRESGKFQKVKQFFGSLRSDRAISRLAKGRRQLVDGPMDPMEIFETLYDFKLGEYAASGGQKLRLIPKSGINAEPITYVINPETEQVLARIPGVSEFVAIEFDGSDMFLTKTFRNQLIGKYKQLGGAVNESLSRGSLYRRRYHGRY